MTNTRITDPEVLERRYPVVLHQFSLRPGALALRCAALRCSAGWAGALGGGQCVLKVPRLLTKR